MLLDPSTVHNLELLRNRRTADAKASLFGVLNQCKTAAGARVLRANLIQPSTDADTINTRLDAVAELLERDEALVDVGKVLPSLADCDRLLKLFMQQPHKQKKGAASALSSAQQERRRLPPSPPPPSPPLSPLTRPTAAHQTISAILHLRHLLRTAPSLAAALSSSGEAPPRNELLRAMVANLDAPEMGELAAEIDGALDDDAAHHKDASRRTLQCLFAVRTGRNSSLDAPRHSRSLSRQRRRV